MRINTVSSVLIYFFEKNIFNLLFLTIFNIKSLKKQDINKYKEYNDKKQILLKRL